MEFNEKALTEKGREREYIQRLIEKACRKTFTRSRNQKSLTCLERKPLHDQESVKLTKSRKKAFEGGLWVAFSIQIPVSKYFLKHYVIWRYVDVLVILRI